MADKAYMRMLLLYNHKTLRNKAFGMNNKIIVSLHTTLCLGKIKDVGTTYRQ